MGANRCADCDKTIGNKSKRCRSCNAKHATKTRKPPSTPRCGATKRNGEPCQLPAGHRTDHLGFGFCRLHLGNTPNERIRAGRQMAVAEVKSLGQPVAGVTPHGAITGLLQQSAGLVAALTIELETALANGDEAHGTLRVFNSERERLARFAKIASDIGVEERRIKIAQAHTEFLIDFLDRVVNRLELTPEQRKALGPAIREEAATLNGEGVEVE